MKIAFVRGAYLNNFELQSYYPLLENPEFELTGFTSLKPMHSVRIPLQDFPSPIDLPDFPYKLPILNRVIGDAMYLWGMENALKGYDIAHVRETYFHFSHQAIQAKKKGFIKKVLVTCSETIVHNHESIWGRKRLKQDVIQNVDIFHCLTEKAKRCLITEGVDESRIRVIPYGIDLTKFQITDSRFKIVDRETKNSPGFQPALSLEKRGGDSIPLFKRGTGPLRRSFSEASAKQPGSYSHSLIRLLFIGRLEEQKGVYELMNAWRMVKATYPNIQLEVIGKGPLDWFVREHGIKPKSYPYDQIPTVMAKADILVLPSKPTQYWEEYFGMVLLEAMASGLPIVTTNCGAIPEVVGKAAMVVAHSHAGQLAAGIIQLISHPEWRKKLVIRGLKRVTKHYNAQNQAEKLGELYRELFKTT